MTLPAEKCSYRSIKKTNMFKVKTLIEKMGTRYSNRCPDHLSRQFLTTASTFPYSSKNSSPEHIHALSTWLITNTPTHVQRQTHTNTHSLTQTNTHTYKLTHMHTHIHTSAEHILALLTWLTLTNTHSLTHKIYTLTHSLIHSHTHTHTRKHTRINARASANFIKMILFSKRSQ